MTVLDKWIQTIRDVADQLVIMKADQDNEHHNKSCKFEQEC